MRFSIIEKGLHQASLVPSVFCKADCATMSLDRCAWSAARRQATRTSNAERRWRGVAWRCAARRGAAWLAEAVSAPPCCATRCMALCTSVPVPLWLGAQLSQLPLVSRRPLCVQLHACAAPSRRHQRLLHRPLREGRHRAAADGLHTKCLCERRSKSALGVLTRQMGLRGEIGAGASRVSRGWTALDDGGYG